jgi:hypothetical protein
MRGPIRLCAPVLPHLHRRKHGHRMRGVHPADTSSQSASADQACLSVQPRKLPDLAPLCNIIAGARGILRGAAAASMDKILFPSGIVLAFAGAGRWCDVTSPKSNFACPDWREAYRSSDVGCGLGRAGMILHEAVVAQDHASLIVLLAHALRSGIGFRKSRGPGIGHPLCFGRGDKYLCLPCRLHAD